MFAKVTHKIKQLNFNQLFIAHYIRLYRRVRIFGISASAILTVIMTLTVFPLQTNTHIAEAAPGTSTASTTALIMTSSASANLNLLVKDSNGTFSSSSEGESAKLNVTTNNYTGYLLTISANDNNGKLTNTNTSDSAATGTTLDSIATFTDANTFNSSTSFNGKWGYLPSKYNSEDNTYYRPAPTKSATTLNKTTCANGSSTTCPNESDEYTIALGARVNYNNPAGTYTNTFILNAVGNPAYYTIKYQDNTGDSTVSNLPSTQSGENPITSTNINLSSTTPTRTNFTFLYWCDGTVSNNGTSCSGTTYTKGASFGIDQTTKNETTLYAVWSPNITIKTNTGISKVTINKKATTDSGSDSIVECSGTNASTTGCIVTGLIYGKTYAITATADTGYTFTSWNPGNFGTIANTSSTSTTYTVGAGASTITPTATINSYLQTVRVRYQNASGGWGDYSTYSACTTNVNYGSSHSCTIAATTEYQAASLASYTVTSTNTKDISVYRNLRTVSLSKGTGISTVTVSGTGVASGSGTASASVYHGGAVTIAASLTSGYQWVNWTGSATYTNQSQSISSVTGNLSFTANGKASCTSAISGDMQSAGTNSSYCDGATGSMNDTRDSQTYTIAKINGKLWMTRNLAIGCSGTGSTYTATRKTVSLTTSNSNVSATYSLSTPTTPNLSAASESTETADYSQPRMQCNKTYGAWYNYAAASAKSITGTSNTTEASYSICPSGWRLPSQTEFAGIVSYKDVFSPVTGGSYVYGSLGDTSFGCWWSSTARSVYDRYFLYYDGSTLNATFDYYRFYGVYVRCVRSA